MRDHPRVLVIYNEPVLPKDHPDAAQEYDVIEASGIVVKILEDDGFPVRQLGFSYDPRHLLDELRDRPPDVVFNMFEGLATQGATEISVVSLLEWLKVSFTGCPSMAIALGRDKIRTKFLLQGAAIPTAAFQVIEKMPAAPWPHAWPAIVKPGYQDCSLGIEQASVVTNQDALNQRAICMLDRFGPPILVEEFISGRELHANIIEEPADESGRTKLLCIPLAEIGFSHEPDKGLWPIYSYDAKWNVETDEFKNTPLKTLIDVGETLFEQVRLVAEQSYRLLGLRDCGRIDIRLAHDGRPCVLEVNPNPYLHGEAIIDGLRAIGRTHSQFIEGMVWAAYARRG